MGNDNPHTFGTMRNLANLYEAKVQTPVVGTTWDAQDLANCRVAQLYGGYVLPGSRLDTPGGVGLVVSQWNTDTGWPYRTMQLRVALSDTTKASTAATRFGAQPRRGRV